MPTCKSMNDTTRIARCRVLNFNKLTGTIPSAWTLRNAFQALTVLDLRSNYLEGVECAMVRGP